MITEFGIVWDEGAFGRFFVARNDSNRFISAVSSNDVGVDTGHIVVVVRLLIDFLIGWVAGQVVDRAVFLDEGGVRTTTVTDSPFVVVATNFDWQSRTRERIEGDVVKAQPVSAAFRVVTDTAQADDVIGSCPGDCVDARESEWLGHNIAIEHVRSEEDFIHDFDAINPNFDAEARITAAGVPTESIIADHQLIGWLQGGRKIEVITHVEVATGKGAFGRLFVDQDQSNWSVIAQFSDDAWNGRVVFAGEVIVVVGLLIHFRIVRIAWQKIDAAVFLNEAGGRTTAVAADRLGIIVATDGPRIWSRKNRIQLHVIDTHPVTTAFGIVVSTLERNDVIGSESDAGIDRSSS